MSGIRLELHEPLFGKTVGDYLHILPGSILLCGNAWDRLRPFIGKHLQHGASGRKQALTLLQSEIGFTQLMGQGLDFKEEFVERGHRFIQPQ